MEDALIIIGMSSVGLLWIFSVAGALGVLWEAADEQLQRLVKGFRR
jgi:hypothetical protein